MSDEDVSESQASDRSSAQKNVGLSIDRQGKPSADTDIVAQSDANTTEQISLNAGDYDLENEPLYASEAADAEESPQKGANQLRVREDSLGSSHADMAAVESISRSTTADKSTIDEQPAESPASAEGSVDEQER